MINRARSFYKAVLGKGVYRSDLSVESRKAINHRVKAVRILITVKQVKGSGCQNTV